MASDDVEVREVEIVFNDPLGGKNNLAIHDITMSIAVNAMPSVTFRGTRGGDNPNQLMKAEDGATDLSLEYLTKIASGDQNNMFSASDPLSVTLDVLEDGKGNALTFTGVSSAPGISITVGKVMEQRSIVHSDQKISGVDMSIYAMKYEYGKQSERGAQDPNPVEAVMSKHVKDLFNWIIKTEEWDLKNKEHAEDAAKWIEETHEQNEEIYDDIVLRILQNSTDTDLMLSLTNKEEEAWAQDGQYIKTLVSILTSGSNFLNTLHNIYCPQFLFQHICNLDTIPAEDGKGSVILHSQVNAGPPNASHYHEHAVDVVSMHYNLGGQLGEIPLGQMLIQGNERIVWGGSLHGISDQFQAVSAIIQPVAAWPVPKHPPKGEDRQIAAPHWVTTDYVFEKGPTVTPDSVDMKDVSDRTAEAAVANANESKDSVETQGRKKARRQRDFLHHWAKKHYVQQALQNCTCSITIPLDVSWGCDGRKDFGTLKSSASAPAGSAPPVPKPVGDVYRISATNNSAIPSGFGLGGAASEIPLFEGYLRAVTHEVAVGEQTGKAFTNLTFTHVKGVDWKDTEFTPKYGCKPWLNEE